MPIGNELTQRLVLVLQKKGMENFDEVKAKLKELEGQFVKAGEALADGFARGEGNILAFKKATAELSAEYLELTKLLKGVEQAVDATAMTEGKAQRDRIDGWARALTDIDAYQKKLQQMAAAEVAAAENGAMEQHLRDMTELQERLGAMERKTSADREQAEQKATAAIQAGTAAVQARMNQIKGQEQAEGDAMRAKAELYARLERMGQEQLAREQEEARASLQAQKEAAGQAIRAKAELYARLERMGEEAVEEEKMRIGAELRARIDAHVRREQADEEAKAKNLARMEAEFKAAESLRNQKMLYEMAANKKLNDDQIKQLNSLSSSIQGVNKFSDESLESFFKIGSGMSHAEQKSKNFAMGLMAVAHAAQDAQYGFGAVVNNIPQIAYAMGNAIPSLEKYAMQFSAVAMIGGTLINITLPYIKQFSTEVARELGLIKDPATTVAITVGQMKAQIEALTAKPYKVDFDFRRIEMAEKRMKDLESALKTFDSMASTKTSIQEESGKVFRDAVAEGGGALALERALTNAMNKQGILKTDGQAKLKDAEDEIKALRERMSRPMSGQEAIGAANRLASLEGSLPGLRNTVREEIQTLVKKVIGEAGEGNKNAIADIAGAFQFAPEDFRMAGLDNQKIAAGLMAADQQTIRDQRESNKFAEEQRKEAARRRKLDEDRTRDLNEQAAEATAAIKPILDQMARKKDAITRQWQEDNTRDQERAEKHLRDAPKVAERAARAQGVADRRREAEVNRQFRNEAAANKVDIKRQEEAERARLAAGFRAEGFAPAFAAQGAKQVQDAMKRGTDKDAAINQVFDKMVRTAAKQEQMAGMMGQATALMLQLDRRQQAMDLQLQRVQQQMGMVGAKRRTLLLPQGQAQ